MTDTDTIRATLAAANAPWADNPVRYGELARLLREWCAANLSWIDDPEVRQAIVALAGNTPVWLEQLCDQIDKGALPAGVREEFTVIRHPGWPGCAPRFGTAEDAQAFIARNPVQDRAAAARVRVVRRYVSDWETVGSSNGADQ